MENILYQILLSTERLDIFFQLRNTGRNAFLYKVT